MMSAVWADQIVLPEIESVEHFATLGALGPKVVRNAVAMFAVLEARFVKDAHRGRVYGGK